MLAGLAADGFAVADAPPPVPEAANAPARGKAVSNRSNHKWGKKGRKQRERDPYAAAAGGGELDF